MNGTPEGPTFEDAAFLETIAKGFAAVKIKQGLTAKAMVAAQASTRQFHDHADQLNAIAKRIRESAAAGTFPKSEVLGILADIRTKLYGPRASIGNASLEYLSGEIDRVVAEVNA